MPITQSDIHRERARVVSVFPLNGSFQYLRNFLAIYPQSFFTKVRPRAPALPPFLRLEKFNPSRLFPEDRDDEPAPPRRGPPPRVPPFYNGINGIRYFPNDLVMREYTYARVYPSRGAAECPLLSSVFALPPSCALKSISGIRSLSLSRVDAKRSFPPVAVPAVVSSTSSTTR